MVGGAYSSPKRWIYFEYSTSGASIILWAPAAPSLVHCQVCRGAAGLGAMVSVSCLGHAEWFVQCSPVQMRNRLLLYRISRLLPSCRCINLVVGPKGRALQRPDDIDSLQEKTQPLHSLQNSQLAEGILSGYCCWAADRRVFRLHSHAMRIPAVRVASPYPCSHGPPFLSISSPLR